MKNALLFLLFISMSSITFAQKSHNVMTFNIRLNTAADSGNAWPHRKEHVADMLRFYDIDICGMQEVLYNQLQDLERLLPEYAWLGIGRDDGDKKGEFSCIFYKKSKYQVLENNTFWLSETPDKVSLGWEAKYRRIVTWAKLKNKKGSKEFYVYNTHFDHQAVVARRESAKLLVKKIRENTENTPTLLLGDFNATPSDEPIKIIVDTTAKYFLYDTEFLSETPHFGPFSTFNGFGHGEQVGRHIDYIFVNNPKIKVKKHATLNNSWNGRFASDHHAVMAVLYF